MQIIIEFFERIKFALNVAFERFLCKHGDRHTWQITYNWKHGKVGKPRIRNCVYCERQENRCNGHWTIHKW